MSSDLPRPPMRPPMRDVRAKLGDLALYGLSAAFAAVTALTSTLQPHRAWGRIAVFGYLAAALIVAVQLMSRGRQTAERVWLTAATWLAVALVPLVVQAVERAAGRQDRAQEEVIVIERAGARLLSTGTPYLDRTH